MPTKKDLNYFIEKANKIHNNKYDYSKFKYINSATKSIIICKIHGEFLQNSNAHLSGRGCLICANANKIIDKDSFVKKANKIHSNKYDYSKFEYINTETKGIIICKIHGEFLQTPNNHLGNHGCIRCTGRSVLNLNDFINKANEIHNNKYDYSKFEYIDTHTKSIIICNKHGEFLQSPSNHLKNNKCPKCTKTLNKEEFIEKANIIHNNKYDYSKFKYIKAKTKSIIICPKHKEFLQNSTNHLSGKGCPKCSGSISKIEQKWLDSLNIPKECRNVLLKINGRLFKPDAYIKETKTIYEFYGDYWHGNPKRYNQNDINIFSKKSYKELYNKTIEKENYLKNNGYNIISIWESDFIQTK